MINLELAEKVADRFWDYFSPSIRSGNQVYFCFSRDLLRSLLGNILLRDPVEEFFELTAQFHALSGDSCEIEEAIYARTQSGRSLAILLIAQQILVVEDMVNEGGISEEAYFPRLRKRISTHLSENFALPMAADEFLKLWHTFRSEIIATGAQPVSITFFGGTGRNKHRSYPLTQALLSSHDLQELADKFPRDIQLSKIGDDAVLDLTKKCRLGSRARRVIRVPWLRHRVVGQIRSYFANRKNVDFRDAHTVIERERNLEFRIYSDEIFEKTFELRAVDEGGEDIGNEAIVANAVRSRLEKTVALSFTLNPATRDYWRISQSDHTLAIGDELIFLALPQNIGKLRAMLSTYWPSTNLTLEEIELASGVSSFAFRVPTLPVRPCCIRQGAITERSTKGEITWSGGIALDERTNLFLVKYPPSSLLIDGQPVARGTAATVNGRKVTVEEFMVELRSITRDHQFNIFLNGRALQLQLGTIRTNHDKRRYGFQFDGRSFSAVAEEIFVETPALFGYQTQHLKIESMRISKSDAVEILSMEFASWVEVSESELNTLLESISSAKLPTAVKRASTSLLRKKRSCPKALKSRFEAAA